MTSGFLAEPLPPAPPLVKPAAPVLESGINAGELCEQKQGCAPGAVHYLHQYATEARNEPGKLEKCAYQQKQLRNHRPGTWHQILFPPGSGQAERAGRIMAGDIAGVSVRLHPFYILYFNERPPEGWSFFVKRNVNPIDDSYKANTITKYSNNSDGEPANRKLYWRNDN